MNTPRWIPADFISSMWDVPTRSLRGENGLLHSFAISSDGGYKHIARASDDEFSVYCERIRSHAIQELRRVQRLKRRRNGDKVQDFPCLASQP